MDAEARSQNLTILQRNLCDTLPDARVVDTHLPELPFSLGLINADYQTGPLAPEDMHAVIASPAYWAFCWGSGLALARWMLDKPAVVSGKVVADIGSGSGVAAIAAALAGAKEVWACDNDVQALTATQINGTANQVDLNCVTDLSSLPAEIDLILLADVLYDRSNFGLLRAAKERAADVIVADSRVSDVEDPDFYFFHQAEALTIPNLGEFDEFRTVRFFRTDY